MIKIGANIQIASGDIIDRKGILLCEVTLNNDLMKPCTYMMRDLYVGDKVIFVDFDEMEKIILSTNHSKHLIWLYMLYLYNII
jgi:hypothetical protein